MEWNSSQKLAITTRDKNILVSAAAGSGKTAVLVERIIRLILGKDPDTGETFEKTPIDKMLIVTFTNAAAAKMKAKIRKTIKEAILNSDTDDEANLLREQLELLPVAQISTFHSFALSVIRDFFHKIPYLEPGFNLSNDIQSSSIKDIVFDNLLSQKLEDEDESFINFLDRYTDGRNLRAIENIISACHSYLINLPDYESKAHKLAEHLILSEEEFINGSISQPIWDLAIVSLNSAKGHFESLVRNLVDSQMTKFAERVTEVWLSPTLNAIEACKNKDWEGVRSNLMKPKFRFTASKKDYGDESEIFKSIKDSVKPDYEVGKEHLETLYDFFVPDKKTKEGIDPGLTLGEQLEEMRLLLPEVNTLLELVLEYDSMYKDAKFSENLIDFNDIEHICIELLRDEKIANVYKEKFDYIFIDEYQDTNLLQEEVISYISRDNNVFMVGDVKQSIYKFRHAEPEIFMNKYKVYKTMEDEKSIAIDLNRNYRSKPEVIDCVNGIFKDTMDGYDDDAKLYPGRDFPPMEARTPELHMLTKEDGLDPELLELKEAELEALEIASVIKEYLGKPYIDIETGEEKPLQLKDIVILSKAMQEFGATVHRTLIDQGIDVYISDSDGYFDTMEIRIFLNLLKVIDNRRQDVELISVLHSDIFGYSFEELASIRVGNSRRLSYFDCLLKYSQEGSNEGLKNKVNSTLDSIEEWNRLSSEIELPKFIWELMISTNYYLMMGAIRGGSQRQANLRSFVDKAVEFQASGDSSLYSFLTYIETIEDNKNLSVSESKITSENANVVRMMTIHKSKGLEFPMVIVAGFNRERYKGGGVGGGFKIHKNVGIALDYVLPDLQSYKSTLMSRLINLAKNKEEQDENLRVLYVALTRPIDYLVATGLEFQRKNSGSFFKSTHWPSKYLRKSIAALEISEPEDDQEYNVGYSRNLDENTANEIAEKLNYDYPFLNVDKIRIKYSVSQIQQRDLEEIVNLFDEKGDYVIGTYRTFEERDGAHDNYLYNSFDDSEEALVNGHMEASSLDKSQDILNKKPLSNFKPRFLRSEGKVKGAARGTVYHTIMEKLDLGRASSIEDIEDQLKKYINDNLLTAEEVEAIDISKIKSFVESSLGERILAANERKQLFKEKPFVLELFKKVDMKSYNKELENNEKVLVQGVIDCFFKESDSEGEYLVLVDYKTNYVSSSNLDEALEELKSKYKDQIALYAKALEDAYGLHVKEKYLYLFHNDKALQM